MTRSVCRWGEGGGGRARGARVAASHCVPRAAIPPCRWPTPAPSPLPLPPPRARRARATRVARGAGRESPRGRGCRGDAPGGGAVRPWAAFFAWAARRRARFVRPPFPAPSALPATADEARYGGKRTGEQRGGRCVAPRRRQRRRHHDCAGKKGATSAPLQPRPRLPAGAPRERSVRGGERGERGPAQPGDPTQKPRARTPRADVATSLSSPPPQVVQKAADLMDAIAEGATSFLITEYKYMGVFMVRGERGERAGGGEETVGTDETETNPPLPPLQKKHARPSSPSSSSSCWAPRTVSPPRGTRTRPASPARPPSTTARSPPCPSSSAPPPPSCPASSG